MRAPIRVRCVHLLIGFAFVSAHAAAAQQPAASADQRQTLATAPSSPPPEQRPALAPPPGPVPLAMNGQLTRWLQVRGELRSRVEGFDGGGFSATNTDAYWMDRFRFNATVKPSKSLTFVVQAQDARAFDKKTGALAPPFRDTINLHQAYGESALGSKAAIRIGRQELNFGEQRLIGALGWANVARTFDGGRVTIKQHVGQFDVFAASVVTITPDAFDKSGNGNALYGTYESLTGILPKQTIEPYVLWRQSQNVAMKTGGLASLHQATTGVRVAGRLPSAFDYSSELAVQRGSVGTDEVKAWAGHGVVGRSFAAQWKPRVFGEYNYASGDKNPASGPRGTFDQLYPTAHDKYGLADQVGWRNIKHLRVGLELKPTAKWQLSTGVHDYRLASATDGLYAASGARIARSITGTAGTHVGSEVDVQTAFAYSAQLQIAGGYAHLTPGAFLKNTTPGHGYSYPFVMVTYVFLGESPTFGGRKTK
jgi:hypothetical protein